MENIDFFSKAIETKSFIPCNQSWSRAFRNVVVFVSIASNAENSASQGAKKGPFWVNVISVSPCQTYLMHTLAQSTDMVTSTCKLMWLIMAYGIHWILDTIKYPHEPWILVVRLRQSRQWHIVPLHLACVCIAHSISLSLSDMLKDRSGRIIVATPGITRFPTIPPSISFSCPLARILGVDLGLDYCHPLLIYHWPELSVDLGLDHWHQRKLISA